MLKSLETSYMAFYKGRAAEYKERVAELQKTAFLELPRYISDEVPLFVRVGDRLRYVTMSTIEKDIVEAVATGRHFVEYKTHKHYYPGFRGDNISFLTGKYYIATAGTDGYLEIPGAPSYLQALRGRLPGLVIVFIEGDHNNGVLRVEILPYLY